MAKYNVMKFDSLDSTQIYARNLVAIGEAADHMAIVAAVQSAGIGRRGGQWVSETGNLYVSVILDDVRDARAAYAVGLAVSDALSEFGVANKIKWPNDVRTTRGKISGSLVETAGEFMIIGVGINIDSAPEIKAYKTTCALDEGAKVYPDEVLDVLLARLDFWLDALRGGGWEQVRDEWLARAEHLGCAITYRGAADKFVGVADDGALVLASGARVLSADAEIVW
ncbi:MAG: biotin--[acetyl-CoA-carboxylase] ligase [Rickettsiales bacterium]|jgi:BirA family biotin operon repressor/biotin-[acetyl-CoA-carboxylase] ligase|nr:biotin--[acetyl-CoA-carboxylase] ligase [Rickettsiales bacterium]